MATSAASNVASVYQPSTVPVNPKSQLQSDDFINLLVTQLQNQDPTKPMSNADLLQQVSQIGSMQSQQTLTSGIQDMVTQNQLSAASGMIGKMVSGSDANGNPLNGVVTSVKVVDKKVTLSLDTGHDLDMTNVTNVANVSNVTTNTNAAATGPFGG